MEAGSPNTLLKRHPLVWGKRLGPLVRYAINLGGVFLILFTGSGAALGEDSFFRFGKLQGDFGLRTEDSSTSINNVQVSDYKKDYQELNLRQNLSIYDPRFLDLYLGFGIRFGQGEQNGEKSNSRFNRYSVNGLLLKRHPVSGVFNAHRNEEEFTQSPATIFASEVTGKGAGLVFRESTYFPLNMSIRANSTTSVVDNHIGTPTPLGRSITEFKIEGTTETQNLSARKKWDRADWSLKYLKKDVNSKNVFGSTSLGNRVIQETEYVNENLTTHFLLGFGNKTGNVDQFKWVANFMGVKQSDVPEYRSQRLNNRFDYNVYDIHSNALSLFVENTSEEREQWYADSSPELKNLSQETQKESTSGGVKHRLFKSLRTGFRHQETRRETSGWVSVGGIPAQQEWVHISRESAADLDYKKTIPNGNVSINYGVVTKEFFSEGTNRFTEKDEPHILPGSSPVLLGENNIILSTVVVTSLTGDVYDVELDYTVYASGRQTYIEWVTGSNIVAGHTIKVSYEYLIPQGSNREDITHYRISSKWHFANPYYAVTETRQKLIDGVPEQLNPGRRTIIGIRLQDDIRNFIIPVLTHEREENTRRIDPYQREKTTGTTVVNFSGGISTRGYADKTITENRKSSTYKSSYTRGLEVYYRRGRWNASTGLKAVDRRSFRSLQKIVSKHMQVKMRYGQWIVEGHLRNAEETYKQSITSRYSYSRDFNHMKLGLKRQF